MRIRDLVLIVSSFLIVGCGGGSNDTIYSDFPLDNIAQNEEISQKIESEESQVEVIKNTKPIIPKILREYSTINQVSLSWDSSTDSDRSVKTYEVSYKKTGENDWKAKNIVYDTSILFDNLSPNTSYEFRVRSQDNLGNYSDYYINTISTKPIEDGKIVILVNGLNGKLSNWSEMASSISKNLNEINNGSYIEIGFDIDINDGARCWNVNFLDREIDCNKLEDVEYENKFRSSYNLYAQDRIFGLDKGEFEVVNIDWRLNSNEANLSNNHIEKYYNFSKQRVFVVNFTNNNQLSFDAQGYQLKQAIDDITKVIGIKDYILIGHYMGGLASRAYIQNETTQNIQKLITINTPHIGGKSLAVLVSEIYTYSKKIESWGDSIKESVSNLFSSNSLYQVKADIENLADIDINSEDTYNTGNQSLDQALDMTGKILQGGSERYASIAGAIYRGYSENAGVNLASDSKALTLLNYNENIFDKYNNIEVHCLGYSDGLDSLSNTYFQGGDGKSYIGSQMGLDEMNPYRTLFTSSNQIDINQYNKEFFDTDNLHNELGISDKVIPTKNYNTIFAFDNDSANIKILNDKRYIEYILQAINQSGEDIVIHYSSIKLYNNTGYRLSQLYVRDNNSSNWGDDYLTYLSNIDNNEYSENIILDECENYIDIKALEFQLTGALISNQESFTRYGIYLPCETKQIVRLEMATLSIYNNTDFPLYTLKKDGIYQLYIKNSNSSDWGSDLIGGSDFPIESFSSQEFKTSKCDTDIDIKVTGLGGSPIWTDYNISLPCNDITEITVLFD